MNALAKAADQGEHEVVLKILRESRSSQPELDLALARACCNGHLEVAETLVKGGADPNGQYETADGEPEYGPVILASCEFLCAEGLKFLLGHGAHPQGNHPESGRFQACTPLEMVRSTYVENDEARRQCLDLLQDAGASR